jgi:hypothetical protein
MSPSGPISAAPTVCLRVRYQGSSCRAGSVVGEAVDDPSETSDSLLLLRKMTMEPYFDGRKNLL